MVAAVPHYCLVTEVRSPGNVADPSGSWRFLLRKLDGSEAVEVSATEPGFRGERLQLLAVIRGLEAIGQPSHVTLVTPGTWISRGIRRDIDTWREMNWMWERFGELHPVKHADLWRRLDRALQIHTVQCRSWRVASELAKGFQPVVERPNRAAADHFPSTHRWSRYGDRLAATWGRLAKRVRPERLNDSRSGEMRLAGQFAR